ncbi:MAG: DUF512 domain-containing protein [Candidatus Krumholzibacteria bacterium]|jgi:putative radical SAM enzyme (TIGR03279 family)|nr:DUF512 domain-containing protein [Candidatus Krumholzibacteria bacterium]
MSVRIKYLSGESGFFHPGDEIISIGGRKVNDQLDLLFLVSEEGSAEFVVRRESGGKAARRIRFSTFEKAAPVLEEMRFKSCGSRCIFCFVDQMPAGLRQSLYKKDDDYRLSFLFGNYVTLNDISDNELDRIIKYNLSPLYVSIHSTARKSRERLFGRPMTREILDDLRRLSDNGITMHAQIVLVPGVNDGRTLEKSVRDIRRFYPACRTLAVVPVGLTANRRGLTKLRRFSGDEARKLLDWAEKKRSRFMAGGGGDPFLYMSDEFYLLARRPFPEARFYGDFEQLSNGVGMCRLFIDELNRDIERLRRRGLGKFKMTVVTGELGGRLIRDHLAPVLRRKLPEAGIEILVVRNRLMGRNVGVSGLLCGRDIIAAAEKKAGRRRCLILPPNCVNHENLLLDNMKPADIGRKLGIRVVVPEMTFLEDKVVRKCLAGGCP